MAAKGDTMKTLMLAVLISLFAFSSYAAETFGIVVYPGAKEDAATTKFTNEQLQMTGSCYRTTDPLTKVVEFYSKQQGMTKVNVDKETAMFSKDEIKITIQNPWMDMQTGTMVKETLVSIVKY
jgi:hypothetical protein